MKIYILKGSFLAERDLVLEHQILDNRERFHPTLSDDIVLIYCNFCGCHYNRLLTWIGACFSETTTKSAELCVGNGKCKMKDMYAYRPLKAAAYNDYSFVALLYNTRTPDVLCLGAIISHRWILDNCLERPGHRYERVKVGVSSMDSVAAEYSITRCVQHENYEIVPLRMQKYNTTYMWAATNALILHYTHKNIVWVKDFVKPIKMHPYYKAPKTAIVIYLHNNVLLCKHIFIIDRGCCNYHFYPYFKRGQELCLEENQYCVFPVSVTPEECCQSQALMIYNNKLLGVMAWSTGCSPELGIDPWVFSHIRFFLPWLNSKLQLQLCSECETN